MDSTSRLRLRRVDAEGEPAAMVATWVMGELTSYPGLTVTFTHPDTVRFEAGSPAELEEIRAHMSALLRENRFAHWELNEA
jgi:hypothetical protein